MLVFNSIMVKCKFNNGFSFSLFVLDILYFHHMKEEKKKRKYNFVKIWSADMQVVHLQLTIQNWSVAPAWMITIFVFSLVDMIIWSEQSVRMIDMNSFLGRENILACFASNRALESQLSCCQDRQRYKGTVDTIWPTRATWPGYSSSACKSVR